MGQKKGVHLQQQRARAEAAARVKRGTPMLNKTDAELKRRGLDHIDVIDNPQHRRAAQDAITANRGTPECVGEACKAAIRASTVVEREPTRTQAGSAEHAAYTGRMTAQDRAATIENLRRKKKDVPAPKEESIMNDYEYELIAESIWNTYSDMGYIIAEGERWEKVKRGAVKAGKFGLQVGASLALGAAGTALGRGLHGAYKDYRGRMIKQGFEDKVVKGTSKALNLFRKKKVVESIWNSYSGMAYIMAEGKFGDWIRKKVGVVTRRGKGLAKKAVPKETTTTTKAQGQEAMRLDPDHPSDRPR